MAQTSNVMSYLNVPSNRMARSTSHESFVTDVSLLSLSSFAASDIDGSRSKLNDRQVALDDLDGDTTSTTAGGNNNADLIKLREDMLEQMLEYDSMSLPKLASSRKNSTSNHRRKNDTSSSLMFSDVNRQRSMFSSTVISLSERDLLNKCSEPKARGSLYKSFSTTDLTFADQTYDVSLVKHCASQAWIPSDYAQVLQCRKRHLKDLKEQNSVDFAPQQLGDDDGDDGLVGFTSDSMQFYDNFDANRKPRTSTLFLGRHHLQYGGEPSNRTTDGGGRQYFCRKAASDENIASANIDGGKRFGGSLLKKLKFSKEIGRKIRDDLLRKIGKQKQQLITNLDLEHDKGRPLTKLERNFMIFHWLQSLDDQQDDSSEKQ